MKKSILFGTLLSLLIITTVSAETQEQQTIKSNAEQYEQNLVNHSNNKEWFYYERSGRDQLPSDPSGYSSEEWAEMLAGVEDLPPDEPLGNASGVKYFYDTQGQYVYQYYDNGNGTYTATWGNNGVVTIDGRSKKNEE